tara:strand:- start:2134 stop:2421 length:288 start_codon:yes stop_codon:yes gene_type:complete
MKSSTTVDILVNLTKVLKNTMGKNEVSKKYINALEVAIGQMTLDVLHVDTEHFSVGVEANDGGVVINVSTPDGDLIDTFEFSNEGIIDEEMIGKT